jgi:hypothetical protein
MDEMARTHDQLSSMLSAEQKIIYNQIVDSVESGSEFFFPFCMDMEERKKLLFGEHCLLDYVLKDTLNLMQLPVA